MDTTNIKIKERELNPNKPSTSHGNMFDDDSSEFNYYSNKVNHEKMDNSEYWMVYVGVDDEENGNQNKSSHLDFRDLDLAHDDASQSSCSDLAYIPLVTSSPKVSETNYPPGVTNTTSVTSHPSVTSQGNNHDAPFSPDTTQPSLANAHTESLPQTPVSYISIDYAGSTGEASVRHHSSPMVHSPEHPSLPDSTMGPKTKYTGVFENDKSLQETHVNRVLGSNCSEVPFLCHRTGQVSVDDMAIVSRSSPQIEHNQEAVSFEQAFLAWNSDKGIEEVFTDASSANESAHSESSDEAKRKGAIAKERKNEGDEEHATKSSDDELMDIGTNEEENIKNNTTNKLQSASQDKDVCLSRDQEHFQNTDTNKDEKTQTNKENAIKCVRQISVSSDISFLGDESHYIPDAPELPFQVSTPNTLEDELVTTVLNGGSRTRNASESDKMAKQSKQVAKATTTYVANSEVNHNVVNTPAGSQSSTDQTKQGI